MKLVLDTNIIHGDFHLQGARISKLCSAVPKLGYEMMIPEVVFDEVVNQYRRELEKNWPSYENLVSLTNKTKGFTSKELDKRAFFETKMADYYEFLSSRLEGLGIHVIPYPTIDLKSLVSKEFLGKKPFKFTQNHSVGYRDALIWETVKSLCVPQEELLDERPQVEFLTENTSDFADSDGSLHSDLVKELVAKGCSGDSVQLITNVQEFFEKRIDRELEVLVNIKEALLNKGWFNRFDLKHELESSLNKTTLEKEMFDCDFESGEPCFLPLSFEDPSIVCIDTPIVDAISVRKLHDESVLIEVDVKTEVTLDFFLSHSDYFNYFEDDKSVFVINWDWNDYYLLAERPVMVSASLSFKTSPLLRKLISSECKVVDVQL